MKILYLLTRDRDATSAALIEGQRKEHEVSVVDLRSEENYAQIVRKIEQADRVVCW